MVGLKDIIELLQRWPAWKRVQDVPDRVDDLEKRIVQLEQQLQRTPGATCPSCGAKDLRVARTEKSKTSLGRLGARDVHYKCQSCGFVDVRLEQ